MRATDGLTSPPSILLLGGRGRLGWELQRALAPLGPVRALDLDSEPAADLARPETLPALLDALAPDVVVNAAAWTAVDRAEAEPEAAHRVNALAPEALATWAARRGAWFVHYSSDYVFDGQGDAPRDETAPCAPLNVYGRSKLDGERRIAASGCHHLVLRTSWLYAARGDNFVRTVLRLAATRDTLDVVHDQVGAPTGAELLADVTAHALRRVRAEPSLGGLYHCAAAGDVSRHGLAQFAVDRARARGLPLRLRADGLRAVSTAALPSPASRPLNSRLDTRRLCSTFGLVLPPWQDGVRRMLDETAAA